MTTTLTEALDQAAVTLDALLEKTVDDQGDVFNTLGAKRHYVTALNTATRAVNDARKVLG